MDSRPFEPLVGFSLDIIMLTYDVVSYISTALFLDNLFALIRFLCLYSRMN